MDLFSWDFKKLDEDDILEIVMEHFQNTTFKKAIHTKGAIFGEPGKDLRLVCIFSDAEDFNHTSVDLNTIDKSCGYNGDHSLLHKNPKFNLSK